MIVIWLIVWLLSSTPSLAGGLSNPWLVSCVICAAITFFGGALLRR